MDIIYYFKILTGHLLHLGNYTQNFNHILYNMCKVYTKFKSIIIELRMYKKVNIVYKSC